MTEHPRSKPRALARSLALAVVLLASLSLMLRLDSSGVVRFAQAQAVSASSFAAPDAPSAPIPLPFNVFGYVSINGQYVPLGTMVGGWCHGTQWDEFAAAPVNGAVGYDLKIPADDPNTPGVVDGCTNGTTVTFTVGGIPADQTATWQAGGSEQVDLTTTLAVSASKRISPDGATWYEAGSKEAALELELDDPLTWQIAISNTSPITVGLKVTDTLDGVSAVTLSTVCTEAPPPTLYPQGEPGSSYGCTIEGLAEAGTHWNTVTATISAGDWIISTADAAYYKVEQLTVYLPLVLR